MACVTRSAPRHWTTFSLKHLHLAAQRRCSPADMFPCGQGHAAAPVSVPRRPAAPRTDLGETPPPPPPPTNPPGRGCGGRPGLPSPAPRGPGRAARSPGNPPRRAAARPGPARPRPARWPRRSGLARGGVRRSPRGRRARWLPPSPSPRSAGALLRPEPALSRRGVTRRRPEQGRR